MPAGVQNTDDARRTLSASQVLDADKSGGLDSDEFVAAIKKLVHCIYSLCMRVLPLSASEPHAMRSGLAALSSSEPAQRARGDVHSVSSQDIVPRIHMSASDFASITEDGELCDERGQLGPAEFENVMRKQIRHIAQSKLSLECGERSPEELEFVQFGIQKMIFMELTRTEDDIAAIKADVGRLVARLCLVPSPDARDCESPGGSCAGQRLQGGSSPEVNSRPSRSQERRRRSPVGRKKSLAAKKAESETGPAAEAVKSVGSNKATSDADGPGDCRGPPGDDAEHDWSSSIGTLRQRHGADDPVELAVGRALAAISLTLKSVLRAELSGAAEGWSRGTPTPATLPSEGGPRDGHDDPKAAPHWQSAAAHRDPDSLDPPQVRSGADEDSDITPPQLSGSAAGTREADFAADNGCRDRDGPGAALEASGLDGAHGRDGRSRRPAGGLVSKGLEPQHRLAPARSWRSGRLPATAPDPNAAQMKFSSSYHLCDGAAGDPLEGSFRSLTGGASRPTANGEPLACGGGGPARACDGPGDTARAASPPLPANRLSARQRGPGGCRRGPARPGPGGAGSGSEAQGEPEPRRSASGDGEERSCGPGEDGWRQPDRGGGRLGGADPEYAAPLPPQVLAAARGALSGGGASDAGEEDGGVADLGLVLPWPCAPGPQRARAGALPPAYPWGP